MLTKDQLNFTYDKFFSENNGKFIERVDSSAPNQCFDLAIYFCEYLGFPKSIYSGLLSAYQIYTQWSNPQFTKIANDATFIPIKGDVIVWSASKPGTGGAGHVAVCTGVGDTNTFQAFSQNDPTGSPSVLKTYNYSYVLGVQRLQVATVSPTPPMNPNVVRKSSFFDKTWNAEYPSANTDPVTEGEVNNQIALNKSRKEGNGKWDVTCDKAGLPHTSSPEQVVAKLSASAFDKTKFLEGVKKLLFG